MQTYVSNARQRFLKPAIEYRNKLFNEQVQQNALVLEEQ